MFICTESHRDRRAPRENHSSVITVLLVLYNQHQYSLLLYTHAFVVDNPRILYILPGAVQRGSSEVFGFPLKSDTPQKIILSLGSWNSGRFVVRKKTGTGTTHEMCLYRSRAQERSIGAPYATLKVKLRCCYGTGRESLLWRRSGVKSLCGSESEKRLLDAMVELR